MFKKMFVDKIIVRECTTTQNRTWLKSDTLYPTTFHGRRQGGRVTFKAKKYSKITWKWYEVKGKVVEGKPSGMHSRT